MKEYTERTQRLRELIKQLTFLTNKEVVTLEDINECVNITRAITGTLYATQLMLQGVPEPRRGE